MDEKKICPVCGAVTETPDDPKCGACGFETAFVSLFSSPEAEAAWRAEAERRAEAWRRLNKPVPPTEKPVPPTEKPVCPTEKPVTPTAKPETGTQKSVGGPGTPSAAPGPESGGAADGEKRRRELLEAWAVPGESVLSYGETVDVQRKRDPERDREIFETVVQRTDERKQWLRRSGLPGVDEWIARQFMNSPGRIREDDPDLNVTVPFVNRLYWQVKEELDLRWRWIREYGLPEEDKARLGAGDWTINEPVLLSEIYEKLHRNMERKIALILEYYPTRANRKLLERADSHPGVVNRLFNKLLLKR